MRSRLRAIETDPESRRASVCGHVIVFSNRPPLENLAHQDLVEFHIDSFVPPQLVFNVPTGPIEEPVRLDVTQIKPAHERKPKEIEPASVNPDAPTAPRNWHR